MRDLLLTYLGTLLLDSFIVSTELPFSAAGVEMYLKNVKRIYVDTEQIEVEPFLAFMNGLTINKEITSLNVYFATDAKTLASDYSSTLASIQLGRNIVAPGVYTDTYSVVSTEYVNDLLVTTVEIRFVKIL